jgi:hypothetical protein
VGADDTPPVCPKKKLFIVCGLHGTEVASPFNAYLFAKLLCTCNASDTNLNLYKLRATYDVYIIPILNGWGIYQRIRFNGNGVDINRNFPIQGWSVIGTPYVDAGSSGSAAGTEFETQLVMAITNKIKPDVAIDHHTFSEGETQFYVDSHSWKGTYLVYQAFVDSCISFQKGLPTYFGSNFSLVHPQYVPIKGGSVKSKTATLPSWWYEEMNIELASTVEVSRYIQYLNGSYSQQTNTAFDKDVFKVAYVTLKNVMFRFCGNK